MSYYVGNAVYDYLGRRGNGENFFWMSGNMWLLVYGDEECEPKVLTVASSGELCGSITEEEKRAVKMAEALALNTEVEVNFIRFAPRGSIENVWYWERGMEKTLMISSDDLRRRFERQGLNMNRMEVRKQINHRSSSPYHEWQRANMGSRVTVADVDLVRLDGEEPTEIIELKRSYIALEKWWPYEEDYANFKLISKLAKQRGMNFYIVYNHRDKSPFYDDISNLKVFEFDHEKNDPCRLLGYETIQEFVGNQGPREG